MSRDYVIISKSEHEIAKDAVVLTGDDLEKIIEHRGSFVKFLTKSIHKYQADHGNFLDVGKEAETYLAINTIKELIKSIDGTYEQYKAYMKEEQERKDKENEKKDGS
jgi:hypothetical protein